MVPDNARLRPRSRRPARSASTRSAVVSQGRPLDPQTERAAALAAPGDGSHRRTGEQFQLVICQMMRRAPSGGNGCLIAPKVLEPVRRQLGVAHRVLNVSVPEPSLQRPGVVAGVG